MQTKNEIYMFNKNLRVSRDDASVRSASAIVLQGCPVLQRCLPTLKRAVLLGSPVDPWKTALVFLPLLKVNQRPRSSSGSVGHASSILSASDRDVRSLSSGRSLPSSSLQSFFFFSFSFLRAHRHSCARLLCGFVSG